jgi:UDP-N-acetyl-D-mannosaminuronic acid dehydrogenase
MDVYEIIRIANKHPRVNILSPGPGVGGHCISVDPWFLVGDFPDLANLIWQARKINDSMPEFVLERIHDIMKEQSITDADRVGLYGLTYKEDVDDVRESPTLQLLECMSRHLSPGLKVYDPWVKRDIVANQYHDFDTFLQDVDMVVIMVSHTELKENMTKLQNKVVLDTRKVCELPNTYRL